MYNHFTKKKMGRVRRGCGDIDYLMFSYFKKGTIDTAQFETCNLKAISLLPLIFLECFS